MAIREFVQLNKRWVLGELIGEGGFAKVYAVTNDDGENAVVKLIPKSDGGDRELLFADMSDTDGVFPILETGEHGDHWVILMPRADISLRQFFTAQNGRLPVSMVVEILSDVASALVTLSPDVVHRDLKPDNIMRYQDRWCVADFGIARYAEASTDTYTWKFAKSLAYASPEQWAGQRATSASDIYSFGVIAYELLAGERPFNGPKEHDYREQHLHQVPPPIEDIPQPLASLVTECLTKAPEARPTASSVKARLGRQDADPNSVFSRLAGINLEAAEQSARDQAILTAGRNEEQRRCLLAESARTLLESVFGGLKRLLGNQLSQGQLRESNDLDWEFHLGDMMIGVGDFILTSQNALAVGSYPAPFDVIASAGIMVQKPADRVGHEGRSHCVWYCDAVTEGEYHWYETAFRVGSFIRRRSSLTPFAAKVGERTAEALSPLSGTEYDISWPFTEISNDESGDFIQRWLGWFADAVEGKLEYPSTLPEQNPYGSWRKPK